MKHTSIVAAAILATVSSVALAQTNSARTATTDQTTRSSDPNRLADQHNLRQQVLDNLQQAGFTDVKVAPESFLVEAKDRSGNPVTMFIGPHSFAEVKTIGASSQPNNNNNNASNSNASSSTAGKSK